jgi:hypothetical protein
MGDTIIGALGSPLAPGDSSSPPPQPPIKADIQRPKKGLLNDITISLHVQNPTQKGASINPCLRLVADRVLVCFVRAIGALSQWIGVRRDGARKSQVALAQRIQVNPHLPISPLSL